MLERHVRGLGAVLLQLSQPGIGRYWGLVVLGLGGGINDGRRANRAETVVGA